MDEKLSRQIYVFKALCLFSIVMASTPYKGIENVNYVRLLDSFSFSGVLGFFIVSGYFFGLSNYGFRELCIKKFRGIVIPWLFCSFVWYVRGLLYGREFDFVEMVLYLLGKGNIFCLFPLMLLCYLVLYRFRTNNVVLYGFIVLNIVSRILSVSGVIGYTAYNLFNYIGLFSIGLLIASRKYKMDEFRGQFVTFVSVVFIGASVVLVNISDFFDVILWFLESFGWLALTYVLAFNHLYDNDIFVSLGKLTMPIYMYNYFLSPRLFTEGIMIDDFFVALCRPFAVIAIMYVVIRILINVFEETALERGFKILFGIRL